MNMPFLSSQMIGQIASDSRKMFVTFTIALSAGWACLYLGLPAPYLMGSLFGVWITGGLIKPMQPYLGVARWFHVPVVLGLGVIIGAAFGGDFVAKATQWWTTALMMIITTIIVAVSSFIFLTKMRGYDHIMAYFCSIPGGQAEAIILAREMVEKDYVVALFHLVRVVVVFVSTPFLLAFLQGQEAVINSNIALQALPSLWALPASDLIIFLALALGGYGVAYMVRLPMAHLLGPMGASAILHYLGLIDLPRVNEFVILAQLAIGGAIGARLSQVAFSELFVYVKDAILNCSLTLALFLSMAILISYLTDERFLDIWLAFVPGGLYEVTLLGLVFGFDVAFIAFHHTTRIMLIFFSMPLAAAKLRQSV
ncbi:MAG: AbrB family transcriptional regulator [Candidatus Puniceispirillaceae bacterium]